MTRKSPAFSFYPDSWIGGTMRMTPLQRAAYIDLLAAQWLEGSFDLATALLVARGVSESDVKTVLSQKFVCENGLYRNERLDTERRKQQERRMSGSRGGSKRQANRVANAKLIGSKHASKQVSKSLPSVSVSDSVSDSYSESINTHTQPVVPDELKAAWKRWEAFVLERQGRKVGAIEAETVLMDLVGRGTDKAIRDIEFTIRVGDGKRIYDSDVDFEKQAAARGGRPKPKPPKPDGAVV